MNPRVGHTVTARWIPPMGDSDGRRANEEESHVTTTGVVESIYGDTITIRAEGQRVRVKRSWITEVK